MLFLCFLSLVSLSLSPKREKGKRREKQEGRDRQKEEKRTKEREPEERTEKSKNKREDRILKKARRVQEGRGKEQTGWKEMQKVRKEDESE